TFYERTSNMTRRQSRYSFVGKAAALLVALSAFVQSVGIAQTVWTDGSGDWFVGTNWSAGVPNSSTQAQINNGGTAQITTTGAAAASILLGWNDVSELGTLNISGAA